MLRQAHSSAEQPQLPFINEDAEGHADGFGASEGENELHEHLGADLVSTVAAKARSGIVRSAIKAPC